MNRIKFLVGAGCVLFMAWGAQAQNAKTRIGFGVTFGRELAFVSEADFSSLTLPVDFANFSVAIRGTNFRFEPTLGYFRFSSSSSASPPFGPSEFKSSNWRVGAVLALARPRESMNCYYGVNVGFVFSSIKSEFDNDSSSDSKTDFYIGPAIGGEYLFGNGDFSLGGEIQINYISIGDFGDGNSGFEESLSAISTKGMIIVRWYIN